MNDLSGVQAGFRPSGQACFAVSPLRASIPDASPLVQLGETKAELGICIGQLRLAANALEGMGRPGTAQACREVADDAEVIRWRPLP